MTKYNINLARVQTLSWLKRVEINDSATPRDTAIGNIIRLISIAGEEKSGRFITHFSVKKSSGADIQVPVALEATMVFDTETSMMTARFSVAGDTSSFTWEVINPTRLCELIEQDQKYPGYRWATEIKEPETSGLFAISPDYRQGHPTLPSQSHAGDAGHDLHAPFTFDLAPLQTATIDTGIVANLPKDHVGLVCPRSGLAAKHSVTVLNAPGVVDQGYTGTISVTLINHGHETVTFQKGDRIAQIIITPAQTKQDGTERNTGKHGSTGA